MPDAPDVVVIRHQVPGNDGLTQTMPYSSDNSVDIIVVTAFDFGSLKLLALKKIQCGHIVYIMIKKHLIRGWRVYILYVNEVLNTNLSPLQIKPLNDMIKRDEIHFTTS